MSTKTDDWEYVRKRHQHFDEAEIAFIRDGFREGRSARDIARDLKCSSRVIQTHFSKLRGYDLRRKPEPVKPKTKALGPARFYKSDFEPA